MFQWKFDTSRTERVSRTGGRGDLVWAARGGGEGGSGEGGENSRKGGLVWAPRGRGERRIWGSWQTRGLTCMLCR